MITAIFLSVLVTLFIVVLVAIIIMALNGEFTDVYASSFKKNEKPYQDLIGKYNWEDPFRPKK